MKNQIAKYLEDVIAAEKSFETQLKGFASEATLPLAKQLFEQHATETRLQYQDLTARLNALGGGASGIKSFLAHLFNAAPKLAQTGHTDEERTTQDLIMAFAVENSEVAMYESLTTAAETADDHETATLARRIQKQEQETADKVWNAIPQAAAQAFRVVSASHKNGPGGVIVQYLEDVEAAERNFEDALDTFSKGGDQQDVQSLMSMMSGKAKTQHERLEVRLRELGGSPSTTKSVLAHLLAFTPVTAQLGHEEGEKSTQHLMIAYAAAAAETAMYECLAVAAEEAGDQDTLRLARELQREEKEDHRLVWEKLSQSAERASQSISHPSN